MKRLVSKWPHWWFAYTESSAAWVRRLPYAESRITVVQNAIDTTELRNWKAAISPNQRAALSARWNVRSTNVGIFVGGLYREKRISFLLAAARAIRRRLRDFELIVIGAGPDQALVEREAAKQPWIHYCGPRFDSEKAELFCLAKVMLLPGLVGLGVLDAFAFEAPLVTINVPYHSPEIDYLKSGANGIMLPTDTDPEAYADTVSELLTTDTELQRLCAGCRVAAGVYTLEAMVQRFADGVEGALQAAARC